MKLNINTDIVYYRDHKEEVALQVQEDQMVSKENLEKVVS